MNLLSRFATLTVILLFSVGCRTVEQVHTYSVDTVVTVKPDSAWLEALIECDSNYKAHLKEVLHYNQGTNIRIDTFTIVNNVIKFKAKHDTLKVLVEKYRKSVIFVKVTNILTWYQKLFYYVGILLSCVLISVILYKYGRF